MALTDEQKAYLKRIVNAGQDRIISVDPEGIKKVFPEAFEPELVDFSNIPFNDNVAPVDAVAEEAGIAKGHGLYFPGYLVKNPKLKQLVSGSWVLTFEKK